VKKRFGADAQLIEGSDGVYKVWIDGDLIWDKKSMGGFPQEGEIIERLGARRK
jgi:selT/selW/selH-like putative selenoprotein